MTAILGLYCGCRWSIIWFAPGHIRLPCDEQCRQLVKSFHIWGIPWNMQWIIFFESQNVPHHVLYTHFTVVSNDSVIIAFYLVGNINHDIRNSDGCGEYPAPMHDRFFWDVAAISHTLRPRQNGSHHTVYIFKLTFLWKCLYFDKIFAKMSTQGSNQQ